MEASFLKTSPFKGPTPLRYSIGFFNMEVEFEMTLVFNLQGKSHKYN